MNAIELKQDAVDLQKAVDSGDGTAFGLIVSKYPGQIDPKIDDAASSVATLELMAYEAENNIVYSYTRAQAIEDGILVDLGQDKMLEVCQQHYKHPIACTAAVWGIMERAVANKRHGNSFAGVLHDMLWMSRTYKRVVDESTVIFRVKITGAGRQSVYDFKLVIAPGDNAEPVITIMLPDED